MAIKTSDDFRVGDVVTCPCPEDFLAATAKFLTGREGVVVRVYPAKSPDPIYYCGFTNMIDVKWNKRNGRGKEKEMRMSPRDVEIVRRGTGDEAVQ